MMITICCPHSYLMKRVNPGLKQDCQICSLQRRRKATSKALKSFMVTK
uniref:Uncharacterized protein n=1 Tax=Corynebacterium phage HS03 TaxID=3056390 RepID=A0AA50ACB4_9VIRU|nr:MAG: hypothetical protein [Corynebacterium phage HS03]